MAAGDQKIQFTLGVTEDGRVNINIGIPVDHLTLEPMAALEMAEGLVEAARMAAAGRAGILRIT